MILKDYIQQKFQSFGYSISDDMVSVACLSEGIDSAVELVTDNVGYGDYMMCILIPDVMMRPDSISEGGISVSYKKENIEKYYRLLCKRFGIEDKLTDAPKVNIS
jgi:hypothetical protein